MRELGLQVERLVELQAPQGATTRYQHQDAEWSRHWPSEEISAARTVR